MLRLLSNFYRTTVINYTRNSGIAGSYIPGKACINSEIDLSAASVASGSWSLGSGLTLVNDITSGSTSYLLSNLAIKTTTNTAGAYDLTVNGGLYKNYLIVATTARTLPTIVVSAATICQGSNISLSVTGSYMPTEIREYEWKIYTSVPTSPLFSSTTSTFTTPVFNTPVTYIIRYRERHECCGWSRPVFASVTVNAQPTASAGGSQTICYNATATVSGATSSNGTILWTENGAGSITSGATTLTPTYTAALGDAGNTVTLTMTVSNSPCLAATATYTVNVYSNFTAGSIAMTGETICNGGDPVNISSLSLPVGGNGSYYYQWQKSTTSDIAGFSDISGANSSSYDPPSGLITTTWYRRMAKDGACNLSYTASSGVWQVVVVADPSSPTATQSPAATTVCNGQTLTITGVTDNGGGTGTCTIEYRANGSSWGTSIPSYTASVGTNTIELRKNCSASGCDISPVTTYTWNVVADPAMSTQPSDASGCPNFSCTISADASGGTGTFSYQWQVSTNSCSSGWANVSTGGTSSSYTVPTAASGTYYFRCAIAQNGGSCDPLMSNCATVTVYPALNITSQPIPISTCIGSTVSLSTAVTGGGSSPAYQWQTSPSGNAGTFSNIGGATANSYSPPTTSAGIIYYQCVISSSFPGCSSVTSNVASVGVAAQPGIVTHPASSSICTGGTASMTVVGTGGQSSTYMWQYYNGSSWVDVTNGTPSGAIYTGSTSSSFSVSGLAVGTYDYRGEYRSAAYGCATASSNSATVTVVADPVISTQPAVSQTVCVGGSPSLSVAATGGTGTFGYQWYSNTLNNNTTGSSLGSGNGAQTDTYSPVTSITGTKYYYCMITQTGSGCAVTSNTGSVTVVADPSISTHPVSPADICTGGTAGMSVTAANGVAPLSYQWQYNSGSWNNVADGSPTGSTYTGGTSTALSVSGISNTGGYQYRCIVTSAGSGCDPATSNIATVTVVSAPAAPTATPSPNVSDVCAGQVLSLINVTDNGGGTGTCSFQYSNNGGAWGALSPYAATVGTNTIDVRRICTGSGCGASAATSYSWNVVPDPISGVVSISTPTDIIVCPGNVLTPQVTGGSGGTGTITDEIQYRIGTSGGWTTYTSSITANTVGDYYFQTRRTATGNDCNTSAWSPAGNGQLLWTVSQAVAPVLAVTPNMANACIGKDITASISTAGSGGVGCSDIYEYRIDGGSWSGYTPGSTLNTTGHTSIEIRATRGNCSGNLCTSASNTYTWNIVEPSSSGVASGDFVWSGTDGVWSTTTNWLNYNGTNFVVPVVIPDTNSNVIIRPDSTCVYMYPDIQSTGPVCGTINILAGAQLSINGANNLDVYGDWSNSGILNPNAGKVTFRGTNHSNVSGNTSFHDLAIKKAKGRLVILSSNISVGGELDLSRGFIISSATNLLNMGDGSTVINASDSSFVNGPVQKTGDDAFTFPTGDFSVSGRIFAPIAITDPGVNTTDAFMAEYFYSSAPNNWDPWDMGPGVDHTSGVEYWDIQRISGSTYPGITIFWMNGTRSGIVDTGNLVLAHREMYNGSLRWMYKGEAVSGTLASGAISSTLPFTSYSPITFGSKTLGANPLPVSLLGFDAVCKNDVVTLEWTTMTETNNDYFTIEHSRDSKVWEKTATVSGAGNSNVIRAYSYKDLLPSDGINYYRLSQTDYDGKKTVFNSVSVSCENPTGSEIAVFPNPFTDEIAIEYPSRKYSNISIRIYDIMGNLVKEIQQVNPHQSLLSIDVAAFARGVYYLEFRTNEVMNVVKIVKN
ncbi:MAG: T9SS type A sorting domain-containing protein [Bacteroidota bacterium]